MDALASVDRNDGILLDARTINANTDLVDGMQVGSAADTFCNVHSDLS